MFFLFLFLCFFVYVDFVLHLFSIYNFIAKLTRNYLPASSFPILFFLFFLCVGKKLITTCFNLLKLEADKEWKAGEIILCKSVQETPCHNKSIGSKTQTTLLSCRNEWEQKSCPMCSVDASSSLPDCN